MHIAIIPDGNRRWARERGKSIFEGHKEGAKRLIDVLEWLKDIDEIKEISIFVLSTENILKRSKSEIKNLLKLIVDFLNKINSFSHYNQYYNINLLYKKEILLNREDLKEEISQAINKIEEQRKKYNHSNKKHERKTLNLLIGYGGRKEIIEAAKRFNGDKEDEFKQLLWIKNDVDILIRTGKETRISNFLLFQIAYAEIFFVNKYWPDIKKEDFLKIIEKFHTKERRFGK